MIKYRYIVSFLLMLFCSVIAAQTFIEDETEKDELSINRLINIPVFNNGQPQVNGGNSIHIKQIGDGNTSFFGVSSNSNHSTINQVGDYNNSYIYLTTSSLSLNVGQVGDNHSLYYNDAFFTPKMSTVIKQYGKGQNLEIQGSNILTENMSIQMSGLSQSIIIRSFK